MAELGRKLCSAEKVAGLELDSEGLPKVVTPKAEKPKENGKEAEITDFSARLKESRKTV